MLRSSPCIFSSGASALALAIALGAAASLSLPQATLANTFRVNSYAGMELGVTDNVDNTSSGKRPDAVVSPFVELDALATTRRANLEVISRVGYDKFVTTGEFDDYNVFLSSNGQFALIPDRLAVTGNVNVRDLSPDRAGFAGTPLFGERNKVRVSDMDFGGALTTGFFNIADINVQGRYAEVELAQESALLVTAAGEPIILPPDANLLHAFGSVDTGTRSRLFQSTVSGEYLEENHGFIRYSGIYSLFARLTPKTRLIGRVGYESTFDPGITNIEGIIWSGGVEYTPGENSYLRVEYGERYDRYVWDAEATLAVTPRLFLIGSYLEALEPEQVRIDRSLRDVLSFPTGFLAETPAFPSIIDATLADATRFRRDLDVGVVWVSPPRQVSVIASRNQSQFIATQSEEHFLLIDAQYEEQLTPQMTLTLASGAERRLDTLVGPERVTIYRSELGLEYDVSTKIRLYGRYIWEKRYGFDGESTPQNIVIFGAQRAF